MTPSTYVTEARIKLPAVLTKYHAIKTCKGMEVQLHTFLTSAGHRDVVSFTLRPHYPRYPVDRKEAGWAPELSGRGGDKIKTPSLLLPGIEPWPSSP
jgi:hypothetical protein